MSPAADAPNRDRPAPDAPADGPPGAPPDAIAFDDVRLDLGAHGTIDVQLRLRPDELALLMLDDPLAPDALIDAACGLAAPLQGEVRVLGHDWGRLAAERANALRGRIGRVDTEPVFPANMTVGESVLLGPRFHSRRPEAELKREAARLARSFGLPGLPLGVPAALSAEERVRAACVRALLGAPQLLIVNERAGAVPADLEAVLINAARGVRARGGAVLWLTQQAARPADRPVPATRRLELRDGAVRAAARGPATEDA